MPSSVRIGLVAALAIACHGALAQTTTVPPAITVQRIAPQLVQFAGSQSNFQNLVAGLTQGTQVQLFTVLPDGATQVVSFTPAPLSADQVAQVLERARQQLIGLGIGNPTGEQLAVALMGGIVPTALGGSQVPGLLATPAPPAAAVQAQTSAAAGATGATTSTTPVPTAPVNVQLLPGTATTATTGPTGTAPLPRINTSDSLLPSGFTSRSPTPPTPVVTAPPSGTGNPTVGAREAAPGAAAGTSAHPRGSASAAAR